KEYIEVMGGGRSAALDDFRELRLWGREGAKTRKGRQDTGHNAAFAALAGAISGGGPSPIPLEEALASSLATICAVESLQTAAPVAVRLQDLAPSGEAENAGN
ncbi:MAG: hypothetical protein V3S18_05260, partial [Dehalococcoidia bacterium]